MGKFFTNIYQKNREWRMNDDDLLDYAIAKLRIAKVEVGYNHPRYEYWFNAVTDVKSKRSGWK